MDNSAAMLARALRDRYGANPDDAHPASVAPANDDRSFAGWLGDAAYDVASQVPQGFNRGLDATINLPYELTRGGAYLLGYDMPEAQPVFSRLNTGEESRTAVGPYAKTAGEFLPAIMAPGGLAKNAAYAVGSGIASEAAGQATEGTDAEPYARLAAALAAPAVPSVLSKANALADRAGVLKYDPNTLYATGGPGKVETATAAAEEAPSIRAYHGSPHDFEKFDISKMGTGEGAQVYGPGLYFAENENVAKEYKRVLEGGGVKRSGIFPEELLDDAGHIIPEDGWKRALDREYGEGEWRIADGELHSLGSDGEWYLKGYVGSPGKMYEVDINASPEHFFEWDTPINNQSDFVKDRVRSIAETAPGYERGSNRNLGIVRGEYPQYGDYSPDGEAFLRDLASLTNPYDALKSAGVPGIRYFDQGSRDAAAGTRNYVVFDDSLISIVRKYGIGPAISLGLISADQARQLQQDGYQ